MWIRAQDGSYVNANNVYAFYIGRFEAEYSIKSQGLYDSSARKIGTFSSKEDAQAYLDKLVKALGERVIKVDMGDWNYTGHKKDHKETRHGGS